MPEYFETTFIRDDDASWDALANRTAAAAIARAEYSGARWFTHSRASRVLAASALAAAAVFAIFRAEIDADPTPDMLQAVAPQDELARRLLASDAPPLIGALLFETAPGGGQ